MNRSIGAASQLALILLLSVGCRSADDLPAFPAHTWDTAQETQIGLATDSPYVRIQSPGILELLLRQDGGSEITLTIRRDDRPTGGQRFKVRPNGWQRIALPLALFGVKADTKQGFVLSAPDLTSTIRIAHKDDPVWPNGTGMSDGQLLDRIDLDRPELSAVREHRSAGDEAGAMRELAHYFRTRSNGRWTLPPAPLAGDEASRAVKAGDLVVQGRFTMLANDHTFPDGVIDWNLDPTAGTSLQTNEWVWSMNRHEIASTLLAAYRADPQPAYPRAWAQAVRSWLIAMPVPAVDWQIPGSGWRYIEAGLRMGEFWPNAWSGFLASPEISDADLLGMVKSFWEHAEFLSRHESGMNNHFVVGRTGLYVAATLFPEFREAEAWRIASARILHDFVQAKTDADGGWYERSPSYHRWLVQKICLVFNVARLNGREGDFSPAFRTLAQRMAEWGVHLSAPDRIVPALNDSSRDGLDLLCAESIRAEFPSSPVLSWGAALAAGQPAEPAPLPPCELLADSGYGVMRTSWATKASFLLFDVGPMGGGHGHYDALNLIYAADGAMTIFDTSGGPYNASRFRTWAKSTAAHNCVLVDGCGQNRPKETTEDPLGLLPVDTPKPLFVASTGGIYACGWHVGGFGKDGSIEVRHRREICFATVGGLAVVIDTLTPTDQQPHAYDLRWQIDTTTWNTDASKQIILPERAGRRLMALVPLAGGIEVRADSGISEPEILGWDVGRKILGKSQPPTPALTVRHRRSAAGETTFITALIPASMLDSAMPQVIASAGGWSVACADGQAPLRIEVGPSCRISGGGLPTTLVFERTTMK